VLQQLQKLMALEGAEDFSVPVDPEALGIPDYFEVVQRPMDLSTVMTNLDGAYFFTARCMGEKPPPWCFNLSCDDGWCWSRGRRKEEEENWLCVCN
jgi:hypothetical protein